MKMFPTAIAMQQTDTYGLSLSPTTAPFLTIPLNPSLYSVLIIVGFQARM